MVKRFLLFLGAILAVASFSSPAFAQEMNASWSIGNVTSSQSSNLLVPTAAVLNEYTPILKCGSPEGCTVTVQGTGVITLTWQTGPSASDFANDFSPLPASGGGSLTLANGQSATVPRGRTYRFQLTTDGEPYILVTGD